MACRQIWEYTSKARSLAGQRCQYIAIAILSAGVDHRGAGTNAVVVAQQSTDKRLATLDNNVVVVEKIVDVVHVDAGVNSIDDDLRACQDFCVSGRLS
jgi:predicted nuclease with RNAse H fold